jgi:hypothetical protein
VLSVQVALNAAVPPDRWEGSDDGQIRRAFDGGEVDDGVGYSGVSWGMLTAWVVRDEMKVWSATG